MRIISHRCVFLYIAKRDRVCFACRQLMAAGRDWLMSKSLIRRRVNGKNSMEIGFGIMT